MLQSKGDNKETREMCQPNTKPDTRRKPTREGQECSENYFKSTDISGIWRADDRQAATYEVEDGNVSTEEECTRRDTDMLGRVESGLHALSYVKELQMWRKGRGSTQQNRCGKAPGWLSLPKGKGLDVCTSEILGSNYLLIHIRSLETGP